MKEPKMDRKSSDEIAARAARQSFEEDHRVERRDPHRHLRGSIKRSHRAEGHNFID